MRRIGVLPVAAVALGSVAAAVVLAANGASVRSAADRGPFYGVGLASPPTARDSDRMWRSGVRTARFVINWPKVEPTADGGYRWRQADRYMRGVATHSLEPLPLLFATPSWVARSFLRPPLSSPPARKAWRAFVRAAAARYGPGGSFWAQHPDLSYDPVHYWQIWNEENSPDFWVPRPSPASYERLLKIAAQALHATDPSAKIVLGGMFEGNVSYGAILSWRYLARLYRLGAARYFDVVGVHPYSPRISGYKLQIRRVAATIRRHGHRGTPIWIDEIGWGSGHGGSALNKGPAGQARMLRRAFTFATRNRDRLDVRRILWYSWRDSRGAGTCIFCASTGLRRRGGSAKPAWNEFRRFALR